MTFDQTDNLLKRSPDKFGNPDLASSAVARQLREGEIVAGRYKIISLIGQGAVGSVYAVDQVFLQKRFAMKTLNPILATDVVLRRFHNEAQTTSRLDHPNLVRSFDFGLIDHNQPFLVMDYVEGQTLSAVLKEKGKLTVEMVLQIFIPICFAIGYAHQEGVVHRDIKPGNILLAKSDSIMTDFIPKIVDFGISKLAETDEKQALTKTGEVFGTPLYMSPEQCTGTKIDKRSDIYSLGCVMFEALAGSAPFVGQTALETMMQHSTSQMPSMREVSLGDEFPDALENIIAKMLEKDPRDRYQSCLEVAEDLIHFQKDPLTVSVKRIVDPKTKSSLGKVLWAVVAVCTLVFGGGALYSWYCQYRKPEPKNATTASVSGQDHQVKVLAAASPFAPPGGQFSNNDNGDEVAPDIKFYFPPEENLGTMLYWNTAKTRIEHDAVGTVDFPKTSKRIFDGGAGLLISPQFADWFSNNDFSGLVVDTRMSKHEDDVCNRILEPLTRFTSVRALCLRDCSISSATNFHINELPDLYWLCSRRSLSTDQIANLPRLRQLRVLKLEECKNVSFVLKKLSGSKSIKRLSLDGCEISANDFELISKCPSLTHLDFRETFHHPRMLTDKERQKCLAQLAGLPNLRCLAGQVLLGVGLKGIKPEVLQQLKAMKKLEVLYVQFAQPQEVMQLQKYLNPKCRLINWGNAEEHGLPDAWFDPRRTNPDIDDLW